MLPPAKCSPKRQQQADAPGLGYAAAHHLPSPTAMGFLVPPVQTDQQCSITFLGCPLLNPHVLMSHSLPGTTPLCLWDCPQAMPPPSRRPDPSSLPDELCLSVFGVSAAPALGMEEEHRDGAWGCGLWGTGPGTACPRHHPLPCPVPHNPQPQQVVPDDALGVGRKRNGVLPSGSQP